MRYTFNNSKHMFSVRRAAAILLLFALTLSLCGCDGSIYENYHEIGDLQLVQTLGIDSDGESMEVTISTGQSLGDQPAAVISRGGASIIAGMEALQDYSAKEELYFAHTRYALLGDGAAKHALPDFLDYIARSTQLRMDVALFVVKNGTAKNLITLSGKDSADISESLSSVERDVRRRGDSYAFTCREIIRSLAENGSALVCAVGASQTKDSVFSETGEVTATPAGYAIIKNGALCGYLDADAARGANILINRAGYGAVTIKDGRGGILTTFPDNIDSKISADWGEDGHLKRIIADVELLAGIAELENGVDITDEEFLNFAKTELAQKLKAWCVKTLKASQDLQADFLGLSALLRKNYPREFEKMPNTFCEELSNAELVVNVRGEVRRTYDLEKPAALNGEDEKNAQ
ncbi:MAG: Ger(x)C family spore germination C-terminal domain-containing protein [Oscillospiraceae bacterium]